MKKIWLENFREKLRRENKKCCEELQKVLLKTKKKKKRKKMLSKWNQLSWIEYRNKSLKLELDYPLSAKIKDYGRLSVLVVCHGQDPNEMEFLQYLGESKKMGLF